MKILSLLIVAFLSVQMTFAAGFEKATFWSAKWSGLGGAASAAVEGADALYFNPAGLHKGADKEVSINFSPTLGYFDGPTTNTPNQVEGERLFSPVGALLGKYKISEKLALGFGYYAAGGSASEYKGVSSQNPSGTAFNLKPDIAGDLAVTEFSLGFGYEINENLSVGAAYRTVFAEAEFQNVGLSGTSLLATKVEDLKATEHGFRLGVQYVNDDKDFGLSARYRSKVDMILDGGVSSGQIEAAAGAAPANLVGSNNMVIENPFPEEFALGAFFKVAQKHTFFFEWSHKDYSSSEAIRVSGDLNLPTVLGGTSLTANGNADIKQAWRDMNALHFGYERALESGSALRFAFVWSSQVTPTEGAKGTFTAPSDGYFLIAGYGMNLAPNMILDFAGEYAWDKRNGVSDFGSKAAPVEITGEYRSNAIVGHVSLRYQF